MKIILILIVLTIFLILFNYFWSKFNIVDEGYLQPSVVTGRGEIAGTFTVDTSVNLTDYEWKFIWSKWVIEETGLNIVITPRWGDVTLVANKPVGKIKFVMGSTGNQGETGLIVYSTNTADINNNNWENFPGDDAAAACLVYSESGSKCRGIKSFFSSVDPAGTGGNGATTGGGNPMKLSNDGYHYVSCVVGPYNEHFLLKLQRICKFSDNNWQDQTTCSNCGPQYTKTQINKTSDTSCYGGSEQTRSVPCPPCPCTYGNWQDANPNECPNCGSNATKTQTRDATDHGGNDCIEPKTRKVSCGLPPCECVYGEWDNPPCSKPCGGGTRTLTRSVIKQNDSGTCKDTTKNDQCNTQACPPCNYGDMDKNTLSNCSKSCGGGTQTGNLLVVDKNGNESCPVQVGTQPCNTQACPPCDYGAIDTSTLTTCSVECGGGTQTGNLFVTNKNGNDSCPTKTGTQSCNTQGCSGVSKVIPYQVEEYWNLYLSNQYNSASNFTIDQPFSPQNSSYKDNFYKINSRNAEQYRDKLLVSTYALTIDVMGLQLPYTTYYYFNNNQKGILQITNGSTLVTTLQLNNNNNNFGTVLNAIYINGNGVPQIYNSQMYFLNGSVDTAKYNIYMIVSKKPQVMQPKQLLSCVVPGIGKQSTCMITNPGQNMAVAFTVNMKSANNTANKQQIIGITMDQNGDEQIVFGAWLCMQSNALMIQRATASNPQNVISNCKVLLDVGLDNTIYVLCNGSTNLYEIYKNGVLVDTNIPTEAPKYTTGKCYIYTSFNSYGVVNGTLSNVVYLASDFKTFATNDLDQAINYMNNNIDFASMEKSLQEGFSNVYTPLPNGSYTPQDLRNMEAELIQELNNFNKQYSYYKKYMYNNRHSVTGDTSQLFLKDDKTPIGPADFPNLDINIPLKEIDIYKNLLSDLNTFNQALNASVNLHTLQAEAGHTGDIGAMQLRESEVVNMRQSLDTKLRELNEVEGSMVNDNRKNMNSTIFANILWTTVATSLVYLVFVHT